MKSISYTMESIGFTYRIPRYITDRQNYIGFTYKSPINLLYLFTVFIYHCFYLITGINPLKLIVTAKGEAKDTQSSSAGIYILRPNPVSGKPHWLQNSSSNTIWYDDKNGDWNIGPLKDLGSDKAEIYSPDDVAGRQVATTWIYKNKK